VAALMLVATGLFAGAVISVRGSEASPSQLERDIPPLRANVLAATALSRHAVRKQMPIPVRISVPAIGLNTRLIPLGLNSDRTVQVPRSFAQVGWFRPGPEPGESGAAVILGHVDSKSGPGAFYRLRALRRGDIIRVTPKRGSRLRFVVIGSRAVPKTRFPTKLIYRKTGWPALRLITCDGRFDSSTGHYVDNYVVFARLIARHQL
jgi:sortase (surface protein transpeptidase)